MSILLGLLVSMGMMFTVWDWRQWRIAETNNYGHGWEENREVAPAKKLGRVYTDKLLKFRIRYPQDWGAKAKIRVTVEKDTRDLPIIADEAAKGITQDREYINTESASLIILTWAGPSETKQLALAKKEDRLYKIEVTCGNGIWKSWSATFEEVYRSLVLL